jgi:two-component system, cell cycle response regulator DivK
MEPLVLGTVLKVAPRKRSRGHRRGTTDLAAPAIAAASLSLTVLVVDDLEDAREMYRRFLEFRGLRVITAGDGVAALAALERHRPDAIVLDLAMPRLTGWEVIRAVRKDRAMRSLPILAVTGQGTRESALDAGADGFLSKPCLPEHLFAAVLQLLHDRATEPRDQ